MKRQSPTTVLLRTTLTRTITLYELHIIVNDIIRKEKMVSPRAGSSTVCVNGKQKSLMVSSVWIGHLPFTQNPSIYRKRLERV